MDPGSQKRVRVEYTRDRRSGEANRVYFSGTIFGFPWVKVNWELLLFAPGALILLWIISLLKFEKKGVAASLNVFTVAGRKKGRQTLALKRSQREFTIGVSSDADITVARSKHGQAAGGEVVIQQKDGAFTIVSRGEPVTVNKREVKKKVLRSGDLIKIEDTEIVFDAGEKQ